MTEPFFELRGDQETLPRQGDTRAAHPGRDRERSAAASAARRSMESISVSRAAKCSASSANPAAASPRWRGSQPGIAKPSAGDIIYEGRRVAELRGKDRLDYLLKVQMVFQDPYASLDPRMQVRTIVGEALRVHRLLPKSEIDAAVDKALTEVGLDVAYRNRYPHQFSGGQRQRIGIARALAVKPGFLVCDEPVSALDVSIQAQVINLFMDIREKHGLTYLFVSHDLGVVRHISDRVAIMYLGRIVEIGPASAIFAEPAHPYSAALIAASPSDGAAQARVPAAQGRAALPSGAARRLPVPPALRARHGEMP